MTETVPERIWVNLNSTNRGDFIEWEAYDERGGNLMRSVPFVPATALEAALARERVLEAENAQLFEALDDVWASARREALEEAAKVAIDLSTKWWAEYKDRLNAHAGSTHHEGMSDGAEEVAAAIRAALGGKNETTE